MRYRRRIIAILLAILMMVVTITPWESDNHVSANQPGKIVADWVNFRSSPGTGDNLVKDANGNAIQLCTEHPVTILDTSNSSWTKISTSYNGATYTGYVASQYVLATTQTTPGVEESIPLDDAEFEAKLTAEGFPESYKNALRALHLKYPTWEFKAIHTNIEWSVLLANECNKQGQVKNLVWTSSSSPNYNWRSTNVGYDFANDKWYPFDGSNWFAASDALVTYYLDPRSYLDETFVFVFESLSYQPGIHNAQGVEAILNGTFMYNTRVCDVTADKADTRLFSEVIMAAAVESGVSPYHIASRIKQEMGANIGSAADGSYKINGVSYYNYFNIGAYDGANALMNGMKYAANVNESGVPQPNGTYGRPWDTVEKAIKGGASFLGRSYISVGQDTLYTQKFNVTNTGNLFSHQYMTNVQAPASECQGVYNAYAKNNILGSSMVFEIPVYLNMPEIRSAKPTFYGHPNNWLKTLTIDGYTLTPTFGVNANNNYSLIVPQSVASINIQATTVNSTARISGGVGTISLAEGTNYININVTAQNGNVRTYKLTVVRGSASAGSTVVGGSAKGDLNGDGKISTIDIVKVQRIIVGLDALTDANILIADINGDGKVSTIDIVKGQRHIVGLEIIQ